jgi:L-glutamine-phosphate cytidylyltransferase
MPQDGLRALVLAAGMGTRLWPLTKHTPKVFLDLGDGTCLLDRQMSTLCEAPGIDAATVVTGHYARKVEARVADRWSEVATTQFNPFFADHGPLGSLWAVKDHMRAGDFVVLNGDTIYRPSMFGGHVDRGEGIRLWVSPVDQHHADDVRVRLQGSRVTGVAKELDAGGHRSAGALAVRGRSERELVLAALDEMIRDPANLGPSVPWHELINHLISEGVTVEAVVVDDEEWNDVDLHLDITDLQALVADRFRA